MKWFISIVSIIMLMGCAQKTVIPLSPQTDFDQAPGLERHDFDQISMPLVEDLLTYAWLKDFENQNNRVPALMVAEPLDKTGENLDRRAAKQSLEQSLLASGRVSLVKHDALADFVLSGEINMLLEQTEFERKSRYRLNWQLMSKTSTHPVWQAENLIEKVQRISAF